ncbi:MAG: GGDEF domain-containing protein [Gammaproteobacteria bacterium]|nr:MAG: GGDEF domain-containing protein [Gammaproteobacteria bacterium]
MPEAGLMPLIAATSLTLGLLLAAAFHRGRAALAALVLLWLQGCLGGLALLGVPPASGQLIEVALVLTPWTLLLILLLAETPLVSMRGLLIVVMLGLQTAIGMSLPPEWWDRLWALDRLPATLLPADVREWSGMPAPGAGAWVAACGVLLAAGRLLLWRDPVDVGLALALLSVGVLASWVLSGGTPWPLLAAVGVGLLASAAYASYRMAFLDALTGLPGRRLLDEKLARLGRRYAVAMVDVDHFKAFNDTHGHEVGDQVLKLVASMLRRHFGRHAYRYGGEEFTVVFSGRAVDRAEERCEGFRAAMAARKLVLRAPDRGAGKAGRKPAKGRARGRNSVGITLSIGVAARTADHRGPEAVLKSADEALYKAKQAGRNRLVVAGRKPAKRTVAQPA